MASLPSGDLSAIDYTSYEPDESSNDSILSCVCRLCLGRSETTRSSWSSSSKASERIQFVTKISVLLDGNCLPSFICGQCTFELSLADEFIRRSIDSDDELRSEMRFTANTTQSSFALSTSEQRGVTDSLQSGLEGTFVIKEEPDGFNEDVKPEIGEYFIGFDSSNTSNGVTAGSSGPLLNNGARGAPEQVESGGPSLPYKCRLCLVRSDQDNCSHPYSKILSYAERIEFVTNLTVREGDGLPAFICGQCTFELRLANVFIRRSLASDDKLRSETRCEANSDQSPFLWPTKSQLTTAVDPLQLDLEDKTCIKEELQPAFSSDVKTEFDEHLASDDCDPLVIDPHTICKATSSESSASVTSFQLVPAAEDDAYSSRSDRFSQMTSLKSNKSIYNRKKKFTCKICNLSFKLVTFYNLHLRTHTAKERLDAERLGSFECSTVQTQKGVEFNSKPFSCVTCGKSFVREGNMLNHRKSHMVADITQSLICTEVVSNGAKLNVEPANNKKGYTCCKCDIEFSSKYLLACHYTAVHTDKDMLVVFKENYACGQTQVDKGLNLGKSYENFQMTVTKKNVRYFGDSASEISQRASAKKRRRKKVRFTCNLCNAAFKTKNRLFLHIERYMNTKPYTCRICTKGYSYKQRLTTHEKLDSCTAVFDCRKCHKTYQSLGGLERHLKRVHYMNEGSNPQLIDVPSILPTTSCKTKPEQRKLQEDNIDKKKSELHFSKVNGEKKKGNTFECDNCNKSFGHKSSLRSHLQRACTNTQCFECTTCNTLYVTKKKLESHILEAHTEKQEETDSDRTTHKSKLQARTDSGLEISNKLTQHVETDVDMNTQPFVVPIECIICGFSLLNRKLVKSHMTAHGNQELRCIKCAKNFLHMRSFMSHMIQTHYRLSELVCDKCGVTFTRPESLQKHLRRSCQNYSQDTEVQCVLCDLTFRHIKYLKCHLKKHGKMESTCHKCDLSFANIQSFMVHMIEQHYKRTCSICEGCGDTFIGLDSLKDHISKCCKNPVNFKYKNENVCGTCNNIYNWRGSLLRHIATVHQEKEGDNKAVDKYQNCQSSNTPFVCVVCDLDLHNINDLTSHLMDHGREELKCNSCVLTFTAFKRFMNHMLDTHYKLRECSCDRCGRKFKLRKCLDKHAKICEGGPVECTECGHCLPGIKFLVDHLTAHSKEDMKCNKCELSFGTVDTYLNHMKAKHYSLYTFCDECKGPFTSQCQLKCHKKECHIPNKLQKQHQKLIQCIICGFNLPSTKSLLTHTSFHGCKDLKCKACALTFGGVGDFVKHMMEMHYKLHECSCDSCGRSFVGSRSLERHLKICTQHLEMGTCFKCGTCNGSYTCLKNLLRHVSDAHEERMGYFNCEKCTFAFSTMTALMQHSCKLKICKLCGKRLGKKKVEYGDFCYICMKKKMGSAAYRKTIIKCNICLKHISSRQSLKLHMFNAHSKARPYRCDMCGWTLATKTDLKRHIERHMTEFRYKCDLDTCNKTFELQFNKKMHMRSHTGEKLFICGFCHRGFGRKLTLKLHINSIHLNFKPFQCNVCNRMFSTKSPLVYHLQSHM